MRLEGAVTVSANPPRAVPVLSHERLWAGLVEKCRRPQDFIPSVESCDVLGESEWGMIRVVRWKAGMGPACGEKAEVIMYTDRSKVEFTAPYEGTGLAYSISTDTTGSLFLTLAYSWECECELEEESSAATKEVKDAVSSTLQHTLEVIRGMVTIGRL